MFYGLHENVVFRNECGYVFIDDGYRVFRIDCSTFDSLRNCISNKKDLAIASQFKDAFKIFQNKSEAISSFNDKEI